MKKKEIQATQVQVKPWYKRWWMIVVYVLLGLLIIGMIAGSGTTECNCDKYIDESNNYKQELETCEQQLEDINLAWDDYVYSMKNYCNYDAYNPICISMRDLF